MIKRTLYFGNPAYLSVTRSQLLIKLPEIETSKLSKPEKKIFRQSIPIEDIAYVVLDHSRITLTQTVLSELLLNKAAVIVCDAHHLPTGLFLPMVGNTVQSERFNQQISMSIPLKKKLWQQTTHFKVSNQSQVLEKLYGIDSSIMQKMLMSLKSGDPDNVEGQAAAYYWKHLFPEYTHFTRGRYESDAPNYLLNYGYAILRAVVARAIVSTGLIPTLGIHHHNKYNAYCLADDLMEPYRPYVDLLVCDLVKQGYLSQREEMVAEEGIDTTSFLTKEMKQQLLKIPVMDVKIQQQKHPLMVAVSKTITSYYKCINGESRKLIYPEI